MTERDEQAILEKTTSWLSWAGTLRDIEDVAQQALAEVREWYPQEAVRLDTSARLGPLSVASDQDDFAAVHQLGLDTALRQNKGISVRISRGQLAHVQLLATSKAPALRITVRDADRVRLEGLHARICGELKRGRRSEYLFAGFLRLFAGAVLLVAAGIWVGWRFAGAGGSSRLLDVTGYYPLDLLWTLTVMAIVALSGFILAYLAPTLELLAAGKRTLLARFRWPLIAATAALLLGVAAAAIWEVVK